MTSRNRIVIFALAAFTASACSDLTESSATAVDVDLLQSTADLADAGISELLDRSTGGNANFLWLTPVSSEAAPPGPLVAGAAPEVEICNKVGECTRNPADEEDDHYHFGLKSGIDEKPKDGSPYRIRAFDSNGLLLGSFVVELDSNRNIPLKFWIGEGFLDPEEQECVDADRCDLGTVVSDLGGAVTVTVTGEGVTEVIAAARFPSNWSPGGIDRAVKIDCRNNLPPEIAPGGSGPLNTGLTQLPWYCDFTVDPALDTGDVFNEPVIVEVCETVDLEHASVVLGRSSGASDFELLPFVTPVALGNCFVDYPTNIPGQASLWNNVTRRLAGVFRAIGPQPLRANMRDGGAGGSTRSFSAINPVIPAEISGDLTDSNSAGIDNITIRLSNGDTAVTVQGLYHFPGLYDSTYTVTVDTNDPDFPAGETLDPNTAVVQVTGSQVYVADFQTSPVVSNVPTILSAVPGNAAPGQLMVFFAQNVEFSVVGPDTVPNVTAAFTSGGTTANGFVFGSPSTGTELYVRVPASLPLGTAQVTLTNNTSGVTGPAFSYSLTAKPGLPEIVNAPPISLSSPDYRVQVRGIDTVGGTVCFTEGATQPPVGTVCNGTFRVWTNAYTGDGRLEIEVLRPTTLSGNPVWVQVQQCNFSGPLTQCSSWSTAVQVAVAPPPAGTITNTIPTSGSVGFGQMVTVQGTGFPAGATVQFRQAGVVTPAQFEWGASSTLFVVRTPPTATVGAVEIIVVNGPDTSNAQPYTFTSVPSAPVITNPLAGAVLAPGQNVLVEAHGIDTNASRYEVELVQAAVATNIESPTTTGGPNGLPANLATIPANAAAGPATIRMRVGDGFTVPFGPWTSVNVTIQP